MWLTGWSDFDRQFLALDELRRRMDRLFQDYDTGRTTTADRLHAVAPTWPRTNLFDTGNALVLEAEVPGMSQKDLQLSITPDVLTIAGERRAAVPEGYSVHRQERGAVRFSRSFALPCRVDTEKSMASVKHGILTVTLTKAAEAQPRQITVKAQD